MGPGASSDCYRGDSHLQLRALSDGWLELSFQTMGFFLLAVGARKRRDGVLLPRHCVGISDDGSRTNLPGSIHRSYDPLRWFLDQPGAYGRFGVHVLGFDFRLLLAFAMSE